MQLKNSTVTGRHGDLIFTTALGAMSELNIFKIHKRDDGTFRVEEACDEYYGAEMTPVQLSQLGEEIIALAKISTGGKG